MSFRALAKPITKAQARKMYDAGKPLAMSGTYGDWDTPEPRMGTFYTPEELASFGVPNWDQLTNAGNNTTARAFAKQLEV